NHCLKWFTCVNVMAKNNNHIKTIRGGKRQNPFFQLHERCIRTPYHKALEIGYVFIVEPMYYRMRSKEQWSKVHMLCKGENSMCKSKRTRHQNDPCNARCAPMVVFISTK